MIRILEGNDEGSALAFVAAERKICHFWILACSVVVPVFEV